MHPAVAGPRLAACLSGRRNRPEAPRQFAGLRVVGVQKAADSRFAAADADDDLVADRERRGRDGVAHRVFADLDRPALGAGSRIERHQIPIERADIDGIAGNRHAAVHPGKSEIEDAGGNRPAPFPQRPSAAEIESDHMRRRRRHVHDAAGHNRRAFERTDAGWLIHPQRPQARDSGGRKLGQRRKAVRLVRTRIHRPFALFRLAGRPGGNRLRRQDCTQCDEQNRRGSGRSSPESESPPNHNRPRRLARYATRSSSSAGEKRDE